MVHLVGQLGGLYYLYTCVWYEPAFVYFEAMSSSVNELFGEKTSFK